MTRVSAATPVAPLAAMPVRMVKIDLASCNDPAQHLRFEGPGKLEFRITGTATNSGTKSSRLNLEFEGKRVSVALGRGMTPIATLKRLQEAMPRGYQAVLLRTWRHPGADVVVGIRSAPASVVPRVGVQANDPAQHVKSLGSNKFQISGKATNNGIVQSFVKLDVGGKSALVSLVGGETPEATAKKVDAELLKVGYRARFKEPKRPGGPVTVTVVPRFVPA